MYGITAVRFEPSGAPSIDQVMMGLLALDGSGWVQPPTAVQLVEVVDRLLEGDAIVAVRQQAGGMLERSAPAALQVQDSAYGGWEESIAFPDDGAAPSLRDLPRF